LHSYIINYIVRMMNILYIEYGKLLNTIQLLFVHLELTGSCGVSISWV